jgi:hypothetical protein
MIRSDRERLLLGLGVALLLHVAVFVGLALAGLDFTPYPEISPVMVTLPDYETVPTPEPEPEPQPEPVEPPPAELAPAEPTPADPTPAPPAPEAPAPARPAQPQTGRDAPPGAIAGVTTGLLPEPDADRDRAAERTPDDVLFGHSPNDPAPAQPPDDFADSAPATQQEIDPHTNGSTAADAAPSIDPRVEALIRDLDRSLREARDGWTSRGTEDGTADEQDGGPGGDQAADPSSVQLPGGGGEIVLTGTGNRGLTNYLPPTLEAVDFDDDIPAEATVRLGFRVDGNGLVVPGTLYTLRSSGYTAVDLKIREAVSRWTFDPAPEGTPSVTAIATLRINRDDVR